jgi:deoxyribonuclease V
MIRHSWDITPREAIALQRKLAGQVSQAPLDRPVRLIAGTDCAFLDAGRTILAVAVLFQVPRSSAQPMKVLHWTCRAQPCRFPYVPGLLSFREAPAVIAAVEQLPHRPDLLMCDGQGLAHPRGFGLASHVGLWLGIPTIGAAKSRLCGQFRPPGPRRGCHTQLRLEGRVIGSAVRTADGVRPLFVSVGHAIDLGGAIRWTLRCARRYRLPEPTRQAHLRVSYLQRRPNQIGPARDRREAPSSSPDGVSKVAAGLCRST